MSHNHNKKPHSNFNNRRFKLGIILNLAFVVIEFLFGLFSNSLALIADAGHNFSDVIALLIAWGASYLVSKKPTSKFTYGFKKSSIIAAQLNSLILLVAIGVILLEALNRLTSLQQVEGNILIIVAGFGIVINGLTTYLFHSGKDYDINIKGAYLHMLADTLVSVGVVISGIVIVFTKAYWVDPIVSIIIVIVIFWSTWKLLRESTKLSLDAVPESVNIDKIKEYLDSFEGICGYHDLHVWALSTTETALTVHLIKDNNTSSNKILDEVVSYLKQNFDIRHTTIQIEKEQCNDSC